MKAQIKPQNLELEFFTEEQCFITELSNDSNDEQVSIARVRVSPGVTTRWHRLTEPDERYIIVAGEGMMALDDMAAQRVVPGDVVIIPSGCAQRITNISTRSDLIFLAVCTPPFRPEHYQDIEHLQSK